MSVIFSVLKVSALLATNRWYTNINEIHMVHCTHIPLSTKQVLCKIFTWIVTSLHTSFTLQHVSLSSVFLTMVMEYVFNLGLYISYICRNIYFVVSLIIILIKLPRIVVLIFHNLIRSETLFTNRWQAGLL